MSLIPFNFQSLSFGSMFSLVSMTEAVQVHLLGDSTAIFVSCDLVKVVVHVDSFFWDRGCIFFSLPWGRSWPCKSHWNTTRHYTSLLFKWFSKILQPQSVANKLHFPQQPWTNFLCLNELHRSTIFPYIRGQSWEIYILSGVIKEHKNSYK